MEPIFELVYISKAIDGLKQSDLDSILQSAGIFNKNNELTGCLIFHNGFFIQLLEGPKVNVETIYNKISSDSRHKELRLLHSSSKTIRAFPNWQMGFVNIDDIKEVEKQIFIDNLITYSEITPKITKSMDIFWSEVRAILLFQNSN